MLRRLLLASCLAVSASSVSLAMAADVEKGDARVTTIFDHPLPSLPGKSLRGVLVEYGPGGSSPSHTHAASAFITATVIEGAVRSRINDGPENVYHVGESFVEMPGDHHGISANTSEVESSKLLAVFVMDADDTELTTPDRP